MKDILTKLQQVLLVSEQPIDTDADILEKNQQQLNIQFPNDYVEFSKLYGSGSFSSDGQGLEVYSGAREGYPDIVQNFYRRQNEFRDAAETFDVPLGLFPEAGGLLPFAKNNSGIYYCWDTTKTPNEWTVVVIWEYSDDGYKRFDCNFIHFLSGYFTGQESHQFWATKWKPSLPVKYEPIVYSDY